LADIDLADIDYCTIEAAVMETARGRWFLAEHARRNRHAETEHLRAVLEQIRAAAQAPKAPAVRLRVPAAFTQALRPSQVSWAPLKAAAAAPPNAKPDTGIALLRAIHAAMVGDGEEVFDFSVAKKAG
jgi:hypothetical protein